MLNDEIKKKLKDKEITIKRIKTSFEKKKLRGQNKIELKGKIEKKSN